MSISEVSAVHFGAWSMLGTHAAASLMSRIGADWLVLDAQHGLFDDAAVISSVPAATIPVYVRVASNTPALIGRALDAGASGVIVPMVQNATEAAAAASACRYAPAGARSWGPLSAYRGEASLPPAEANSRVSCAVMVETASAVGEVATIAATPGVDIVFVGPFDLAIALGVDVAELLADRSPGNALDEIVAACRAAGTVPGAFAGSKDAALELQNRGFTWIALAVDTQLITSAGTALIESMKASPTGTASIPAEGGR